MVSFCVQCRSEIPEKRQSKGMHFCKPECAREYKNARRGLKASKKCRLCGRVIPPPKPKKSLTTPVRSEHTSVPEEVSNAI